MLRPIYMEIDCSKYRENIRKIKRGLKGDSDLMLVLKDDAYGAGAIELASIGIEEGISHFAVSNLSEALDLRGEFPDIDILILGFVPFDKYKIVLDNHLELNIWSYKQALELSLLCQDLSSNVGLHISLDTGLSRLGFLPNDTSLEEIKKIKGLEGVEIKSLFSHFARTETDYDDFSYKQLELFLDFADRLKTRGIWTGPLHIADSAAIVKFPQSHLNMVRCGALALGSMKGKHIVEGDTVFNTEEVISLRGQIARVEDFPPGTSVSYDNSFTSENAIRVLTLPIGYGDGLCVALEGKMEALIKGKRIKQVGALCMDMLMFDATGIDCEVGDWVTLLGEDGDQVITLDDWANLCSFSPTFLQSMLRDRIPKIYRK